MRLTGAEILIKCLEEQGVDIIFGYPGGAVLPIYDVLYFTPTIRHVRTCHEQGAAHAADGYARATGKVGVCLATSGPGATNLVTGIATAYMDSVPIVAITGQVPRNLLGKDSFQEVDITGITIPITKHNYLVKDVEKLADTIREAFYIAKSGRPGPVLIDLPKDVMLSETEFSPYDPKKLSKSFPDDTALDLRELDCAVNALNESKKPVLYVGGGVINSGATEQVVELAEKFLIPVTTTLMGIGGFPGKHPLYLGMLGMHGTAPANFAISHCDLLIAVGARFDDRAVGKFESFAPEAKIIHIDIDPAEIGKNIHVDIPIVGDVKKVLEIINSRLEPIRQREWLKQVDKWKKDYPLKYCNNGKLKPQYIIEQIYELTDGDAIITTEVGQNQMWAAQFYRFKNPRSLISSGGLGTMGYGLPAALGAQLGRPDKKVFNIAGDGSFLMNCHELATAVNYKLPINIILLNNQSLGMVRQWQDMFFGKRFSSVNLEDSTDFVKLAEAYGAVGLRVKKKEDVRPILMKALNIEKPVLIECVVDPDEKVFPMVPAGGALHEMIGI